MACFGKLWHIFLKQLIIQEVTLSNILFLHISNLSKSITLSMQVLSLVQPPSSDSPAAFMLFFWLLSLKYFLNGELLWRTVCFTLFLWHILVLLSWTLEHRVKVRSVDINTTTESKQCDKDHLREGYSSSKHDFLKNKNPNVETRDDPERRVHWCYLGNLI